MSIILHKENEPSKQENSSKVSQQNLVEKFYVLAQMLDVGFAKLNPY